MGIRNTMKTLSTLAILVGLTSFASAAEQPNIIIMMGDDMGYSDLGCYGGEINTPNLNDLAYQGLRFSQFYNTARCCPTRASLLTGLYPHQAGVGHMMSDRGFDGYRGDLNRHCMTIGEVLRSAGYATAVSGKWHVTPHRFPDGPKYNWPLQRGFDRFYGTIHGAGSFFDPNSLTRDNTMISPYADSEYEPEEFYYTDAISDHAVRFIKENHENNADQPFFIYVSYTAAHWPMHALEKDIAKYKGRYNAGYHATRARRLQRLKQLGLVNYNSGLSPAAGDWATVINRDWELRCMEVYAAMVDNMDQGVGRIVNALKETDDFENTLIFFLQDNGGCAEGNGRRPGKHTVRADKPTLPPMEADELQFDMVPKKSRDGYPILTGPKTMPGPADTYIAYGRAWANVSNTPFREYKHWVHEGGISTPLIAHWPKGIQRRGFIDRQPGHLIDLMATCVDVSGATYPDQYNGFSTTPLEGRSLKPAFSGGRIQRDALYWEHEGNRAVRVGDWKLVAKGANGPWELYNLATDRTEMNDVAKRYPGRTDQLAATWNEWARRAHVLPLNPGRKPKPPTDTEAIKQALKKELRRELRKEFKNEIDELKARLDALKAVEVLPQPPNKSATAP